MTANDDTAADERMKALWSQDKAVNALEAKLVEATAALRDVLFATNNMHVNEVHNRKRQDVNEFCVKIRDIAADALARLNPAQESTS